MRIGFIGLGKMGGNMVTRLLQGDHEVVVYDRDKSAVEAVVEKGAESSGSIKSLIAKLPSPKIVWIMVPAGEITHSVIEECSGILNKGDIIVDGGNSYFNDTIKQAHDLDDKGIEFMDAGTSGGIWGLQIGYCIMAGASPEVFRAVEPVLKTLAPENGYLHTGPVGSGHFVKMVHNGIEYALMQAYGEGFEILKAKEEFNLNLPEIAKLWNNGSVIRSWLLELAESALSKNPDLNGIRAYVEDSGEGRWTVAEGINLNVPAPVITLSLLERFASRQEEPFRAKIIAALRDEFGGHGVKKDK